MKINEFISKLEENNLPVSSDKLALFDKYYKLLKEYNEVMDLTNIIEEEEVYEKHFYDSLTIAFNSDFNYLKVCDIGTGAGFPAIPLKIMFPEMELTIIDSMNKRMNFLKVVIEKLQLKNITIIAQRAEDVITNYRQHFDIVTARAVAKLNVLLELCLPFVKVNGTFIALKGKKALEELEQSENALLLLNAQLIKEQTWQTSDKHGRINLYFLKNKPTNKKYPRKYSQIKSNPL